MTATLRLFDVTDISATCRPTITVECAGIRVRDTGTDLLGVTQVWAARVGSSTAWASLRMLTLADDFRRCADANPCRTVPVSRDFQITPI